jgi:hypothetical protein
MISNEWFHRNQLDSNSEVLAEVHRWPVKVGRPEGFIESDLFLYEFVRPVPAAEQLLSLAL